MKPALSVVRHSVAKDDLATIGGRMRHFREALVRQQLSPRTVHGYVVSAQKAEWFCEQAGYSLRNVPAIVLGQYVDLAPKSYASRSALRKALRWYWTVFARKDAPLWMVRVPRKPRMICRALTDDEAARLAEVARARGDKAGMATLLGMYQGLRREEISAVAWGDFADDGWLSVMGKADQPARIPVHPVVAEAVAVLPREHPHWLFPARKPGSKAHACPATVWSWVTTLAAEAGLERVTPHRLRHTCLAVANDNTGDLRAVQDFARHAKVDTTAGYTRTTVRRLIAVMNAINYDPGAADRLELERRLSAKLGALATDDLAVLMQLVDELAVT